jgi:LacI family transcriptional regulator
MKSGPSSTRERVTIKEVARHASLSVATVSRVLNGKFTVAPDLVERVRASAAELRYQPNRVARDLRRQVSSVWSVIVSDIGNPFFTTMVHSIEEEAAVAGYSIVLCNSGDDPRKEATYVDIARAQNVAGIIISPASEVETDLAGLADAGIPVVAVDRLPIRRNIGAVLVDNVFGSHLGTTHLINEGYKRIAFIGGPPHTTTARERRQGYETALLRAGIGLNPDLIVEADFRQAGGARAMRTLLDRRDRPDAVLAANNLMGLGALECLIGSGLRVPDDLGLVTWDDLPWTPVMRPSLTVVAQNVEEIGRTAARLLLDAIAGLPGADRHVVLPPELRVRDSSRRIDARRNRALGPLPRQLTPFEKTITQEDATTKPNDVSREEAMLRVTQGAMLSVALIMSGAHSAKAAEALTGELAVWDWQYTSEKWGAALKQIDEEFMKLHPGVTIKHVGQPNDTYYQLIQAANSSQTGPDVAMMHAGTFGVLKYTDSLEPLNDRLTPEMRAAIKGWESVGENFDANGKIYGVPGSLSGWVFYYNKALFRQAGLDPENPPKTFDELIVAAEKLKAAGLVAFGGGNADGWGNLQYLNILFPGNFDAAASAALANGKIPYNGDAFKAVNEHLVQLLTTDGFFDPGYASTVLWTEGVAGFQAGQAAMIAGIASDTVSYNEFLPDLGDDLGVFYAPAATVAAPYIPVSSGPVWSMTRYAKNKDLAWAYIAFVTSAKGAEIQHEMAGVLPINSAYKLPDDAPAFVRNMVDDLQTKDTFLYASSLMKQDIAFDWIRKIQDVVNDITTLDDALDQLQAMQEKSG